MNLFFEDEDGSPDERGGSGGDASGSEEEFCHLAELAELENLIEVAIHSADFFGHQVSFVSSSPSVPPLREIIHSCKILSSYADRFFDYLRSGAISSRNSA